jgi:hypothetical protein
MERLLWFGTIQLVTLCAIGWIAARNLAGGILAGFSLFLSSIAFFGTFEMFPALIRKFHLDTISLYYAYRANYIYDEQLIYREKPFNQSVTAGFRGAGYSPRYGIDVAPMNIEWKTDKDGFRNSGGTDFADIVVVGDSYMEYGENESDTFPKRLQEKLPGLTVMNLAKSGYGPFQYLEVLKRYGLKYKPKFALFAFYEGNDLHDIRNYMLWKAGKITASGEMPRIAAQKSFLGRYRVALITTARGLGERGLVSVHAAVDKISLGGAKSEIHPDLAVLELGDGKAHKINLADTSTRSPSEKLGQENWLALDGLLREFRNLSAAHQITPVVLYIPSASHIYAQFSTDASGGNWLALRDREIATKENTENTVARLASALGLNFISFSPAFERRASEGELLYHSLDPHWNSRGQEIAANVVADALKADLSVKRN